MHTRGSQQAAATTNEDDTPGKVCTRRWVAMSRSKTGSHTRSLHKMPNGLRLYPDHSPRDDSVAQRLIRRPIVGVSRLFFFEALASLNGSVEASSDETRLALQN